MAKTFGVALMPVLGGAMLGVAPVSSGACML
jgi:hypothetical protein